MASAAMSSSDLPGFDAVAVAVYRVPTVPGTILYLPNFVTPALAESLLHSVYSAPKPKWTQLRNRYVLYTC